MVHDMRCSAAKALPLAGVPESVIMATGGWRSSTKFPRYAIVSSADQRAAMAQLEKARAAQMDGVFPKPEVEPPPKFSEVLPHAEVEPRLKSSKPARRAGPKITRASSRMKGCQAWTSIRRDLHHGRADRLRLFLRRLLF